MCTFINFLNKIETVILVKEWLSSDYRVKPKTLTKHFERIATYLKIKRKTHVHFARLKVIFSDFIGQLGDFLLH